MKVAVITPLLAQYLLDFWEGVKAHAPDIEVTIFSEYSSLSNRKTWQRLNSDLVNIHYLDRATDAKKECDFQYDFANDGLLKQCIDNFSPDVIVVNSLRQLYSLGLINLIKRVNCFHFEETLQFYKQRALTKRILFKILSMTGLRFITVSQASWQCWHKSLSGLKKAAKCSWVYKKLENNPIEQREFDFIFVGQFIERKGFDLLLDVVPKMIEHRQDIKFLFVGYGELQLDAQRLQNLFPDNIAIKLNVPSNLVDSFLSNSKFLLLPSREDIFGMVIMEALASSVTTIVSKNVGSHMEVENLELGYVLKSFPKLNEIEILDIYDSHKFCDVAMNGKTLETSIQSAKNADQIIQLLKE